MDIWQALQYVGTGLSLVAFIVAALLLAYRARLKHRAEMIKSAPEKERLEAIATTAEFFRVDVSGLTRAQQQDIALTQIHARARRDLLLAGVSLVVAILLAAIAIAAIWASKSAGSPIVLNSSGSVTAGRDITGPVNIGLDEKKVGQRVAEAQKPLAEQLEKLVAEVAREKGVPIAPLKAILARLGEFNVPEEQIPARLAAQVDAYLALKEQWRQVGATNSDLDAVRNKALLLMDTQGDLKGAKAILENARKELKARREANLLTEATLIGDEARIESLQSNYLQAAYLQAAQIGRIGLYRRLMAP